MKKRVWLAIGIILITVYFGLIVYEWCAIKRRNGLKEKQEVKIETIQAVYGKYENLSINEVAENIYMLEYEDKGVICLDLIFMTENLQSVPLERWAIRGTEKSEN